MNDAVFFDAMLDKPTMRTQWKSVLVWRGERPRVTTELSKQMQLKNCLTKEWKQLFDKRFENIPVVSIPNNDAVSSNQEMNSKPRMIPDTSSTNELQSDLLSKNHIETPNLCSQVSTENYFSALDELEKKSLDSIESGTNSTSSSSEDDDSDQESSEHNDSADRKRYTSDEFEKEIPTSIKHLNGSFDKTSVLTSDVSKGKLEISENDEWNNEINLSLNSLKYSEEHSTTLKGSDQKIVVAEDFGRTGVIEKLFPEGGYVRTTMNRKKSKASSLENQLLKFTFDKIFINEELGSNSNLKVGNTIHFNAVKFTNDSGVDIWEVSCGWIGKKPRSSCSESSITKGNEDYASADDEKTLADFPLRAPAFEMGEIRNHVAMSLKSPIKRAEKLIRKNLNPRSKSIDSCKRDTAPKSLNNYVRRMLLGTSKSLDDLSDCIKVPSFSTDKLTVPEQKLVSDGIWNSTDGNKVLVPWDDDTPHDKWIQLTDDLSKSSCLPLCGDSFMDKTLLHKDLMSPGSDLLPYFDSFNHFDKPPITNSLFSFINQFKSPELTDPAASKLKSLWVKPEVSVQECKTESNILADKNVCVGLTDIEPQVSALPTNEPSSKPIIPEIKNQSLMEFQQEFDKELTYSFDRLKCLFDVSKLVLRTADDPAENIQDKIKEASEMLLKLTERKVDAIPTSSIITSDINNVLHPADSNLPKMTVNTATQTYSTGEILSQHIYSGE